MNFVENTRVNEPMPVVALIMSPATSLSILTGADLHAGEIYQAAAAGASNKARAGIIDRLKAKIVQKQRRKTRTQEENVK